MKTETRASNEPVFTDMSSLLDFLPWSQLQQNRCILNNITAKLQDLKVSDESQALVNRRDHSVIKPKSLDISPWPQPFSNYAMYIMAKRKII